MPAEVGLRQIAPWLADKQGQIEVANVPIPLRATQPGERLFAAVTASAETAWPIT